MVQTVQVESGKKSVRENEEDEGQTEEKLQQEKANTERNGKGG
jgi:hypothetical protein